jgi:hypothetical protein
LGHRIFHKKTYPVTACSGRIKIAISDPRSHAEYFGISTV